jgi:hypothetical protein
MDEPSGGSQRDRQSDMNDDRMRGGTGEDVRGVADEGDEDFEDVEELEDDEDESM